MMMNNNFTAVHFLNVFLKQCNDKKNIYRISIKNRVLSKFSYFIKNKVKNRIINKLLNNLNKNLF